jgi:hypothetical protein
MRQGLDPRSFLGSIRANAQSIEDIEGFQFFFWSNEGDQPGLIHVAKASCEANFWISREIQPAWNASFEQPQLRRILELLEENKNATREAWHKHFRSGN